MKKTPAALLLVLTASLLTSSLISCGETAAAPDDSAAPDNKPAETVPAATEEVTTSIYETLQIPEGGFGGATYSILCRTTNLDEMYAESENGDVVNDAVYRRNRAVSENLNIDVNVIDIAGDWANKDAFVKYVTSTIMAGDDAFQLIAGYMNYMPVTIQQNLYVDIKSLPNIDFSNPWWVAGYNDNVTINDKTYTAMGDICSSMLRYAFCGYANKTLLEQYDYSADALYDAVRNGKWTFEMMTSMAKNIYGDLNGDGAMTSDADMFGVGMHEMPIRALTNAFAIDYTTRDKDNLPQLALFGDRFLSAYEDVMEACNSPYWNRINDANTFKENRLLFYFDVFGACTILRDMEAPFCVVPMPKYDEAQKSYRTETVDTTSILFVPNTIQNPELAGTALECMNYESWKLVTPAYFDKALQTKYARDESSQEMMQIVRDSIYFDFGYVYAGVIGGVNGTMAYALEKTDITSQWNKNVKSYEKNLDKLLQYYRDN